MKALTQAVVGRDRPRASQVQWITEATVAGLRDLVGDGRCAHATARHAQQR